MTSRAKNSQTLKSDMFRCRNRQRIEKNGALARLAVAAPSAYTRHGKEVDMDTVKELVRQHGDRRAATFDKESPSHSAFTDAQAHAWHRMMSEVAGPVPLDALDVGCGTGFLSLLLAELGHRVTGIDMAPSMLAQARANAATRGLAANFIEADAEAPNLPLASLDLIVERHLLGTLPHPEAALHTSRNLRRPGGPVGLSEGLWDNV